MRVSDIGVLGHGNNTKPFDPYLRDASGKSVLRDRHARRAHKLGIQVVRVWDVEGNLIAIDRSDYAVSVNCRAGGDPGLRQRRVAAHQCVHAEQVNPWLGHGSPNHDSVTHTEAGSVNYVE